ncbi:Cellulose synthase-like protein E2 [Dendrobium catenatum]|uniref:Cellulose synthase-like protein E2 n=1 Tax=Dendrobium catenatum TaxID=906689 RepID=A0A2I0W247_9ASPA|nr:Cellulose synthase-like protein E2 [Dendrobium catenatum]
MDTTEGRLFEVKVGKGRAWKWLYAGSMLLGLLLIWVYRASHVPEAGEKGRWAWTAVFAAELWFGFYWFLTLSIRWNPIYRYTYKDKLSHRRCTDCARRYFGSFVAVRLRSFDDFPFLSNRKLRHFDRKQEQELAGSEDKLPAIDVFICTTDPTIEPPIVVINTVLSVLAYDYPPEKLNVYLSDDGGSILTFYAMIEASLFAKSWIPFCKKFNVKYMAPSLFFSKSSIPIHDPSFSKWVAMEKLYKEMKSRIEASMKLGDISNEIKAGHEGFTNWSSKTSSNDHHAIIKLRISEQISNGSIILTIDCDMCANNVESIRDALCFFMDEERGHEYAFVQFPHNFENLTQQDLYASSFKMIHKVYFPGLDGLGGPMYTGSCCFHRRDCLNGRKYSELNKIELKRENPKIQETNMSTLEERTKNLASCSYEENTQWGKEVYFPGLDGLGGPMYTGSCCFHRRDCLNGRKYSELNKIELKRENPKIQETNMITLEERIKNLASCTYEENTQWGKEMGLKYGCPVEDVMTGFSIKCRGWKSAYFSPKREPFLGLAPTTLSQALIQHKRWSEGYFQILLSKFCPFLYGFGKTKLGLQMGYSICCFWAINSIPTLIYIFIPSICLINGIFLFPSLGGKFLISYFAEVESDTHTTGKHAITVGISGGYFCAGIDGAGSGGMMRRKVYGVISGGTDAGNLPASIAPEITSVKRALDYFRRRLRTNLSTEKKDYQLCFSPSHPFFLTKHDKSFQFCLPFL